MGSQEEQQPTQLVPPAPQPVSLEALMQAAEPLAKTYLESQREMQRRELEFEEKVFAEQAKRDRVLVICAASVVAVVLILASLLILKDRDAAAVDLIKLVATIVGVGLGGYGLAKSRWRPHEDDD